jgi:hypothetical protein
MPNQNLAEPEIQEYLKYFHWVDAQPAAVSPEAGH